MFEKELEVALEAAIKVVPTILEIYNSNNLGVEIKDDNSPVTKADKAADKLIREYLSKYFPSYALLTEESVDDKSRLTNDYVWIVDPIDGTKEYVAHSGEFTVNIGLAYKHEPVLGVIVIPVTGEVYYALKGKGSFYQKDGKITKIHVNSRISVTITLLKEALMCACPFASTLTTFFLVAPVFFAIISIDYLVAFFLFATVFFLPFLVRALFFVLWPLTGSPFLCRTPR